MERKLATIRKVSNITPILGADKIECIQVDGWQVVCNKGDFKIGDMGAYFEVDCFLPIEERFEFLRKNCYKKMVDGGEGHRLRTVRLRKCLSQGLLMPLSQFPELQDVVEGQDVTNLLGVKLYEPPIPAQLHGEALGNFPYFIPKTDQERIQNLPEYFDLYKDVEFEITEKLDGTSCTFYYNEGHFGVCSRNLELKESDSNVYWKIAGALDLESKLSKVGIYPIAIQGEIIGEGIQGNPYKVKGQRFYCYDIYNIAEQRYFANWKARKIANECEIDYVPRLEVATTILNNSLLFLLDMACFQSLLNVEVMAEGIVCKAQYIESRMSFKVINNEYLLAEK